MYERKAYVELVSRRDPAADRLGGIAISRPACGSPLPAGGGSADGARARCPPTENFRPAVGRRVRACAAPVEA